ncbi:MAG: ice-binding family protein [Rectinemataceae bacterium]
MQFSREDVWIFQISENLTMAGGKSVILSGGALPKNIFWQVAGGTGVTLGAHTIRSLSRKGA